MPTVQLTGTAVTGLVPHQVAALSAAVLPTTVHLGRVKPKARPQTLLLGNYLNPKLLTAMPPSTNWRAKAAPSLARVYLNDRQGCCVISSKYHTLGVWTANDSPSVLTVPDSEIQSMYNLLKAGPGDSGCVITDVLDYFRQTGMLANGGRKKIDGYVAVNHQNQDLVKAATYLFGGPTLGIDLPEAWTQNAVWDVTNSSIVGGHDVPIVDFDDQGVYVSSWGRVYLITWRAFTSPNWIEEAYALLGQDWYNQDNLAPNGVDITALKDDLDKLSHGQLPPIDPTPPSPPVPPAPPSPPPPPVPVSFPPYTVSVSGSLPGPFGGSHQVTLTGTATPQAQQMAAGSVNWFGLMGDVMQFVVDFKTGNRAGLIADAEKILADLGVNFAAPGR